MKAEKRAAQNEDRITKGLNKKKKAIRNEGREKLMKIEESSLSAFERDGSELGRVPSVPNPPTGGITHSPRGQNFLRIRKGYGLTRLLTWL